MNGEILLAKPPYSLFCGYARFLEAVSLLCHDLAKRVSSSPFLMMIAFRMVEDRFSPLRFK